MAMMTGAKGEFFRAILSSQPYKPGQGMLARNATIAAFAVILFSGAYSWSLMQVEGDPVVKWVIPFVVGIAAMWVAYRLVHYPRFADFLISTEAEMNKVSWPTKSDVKASTIVVLILAVLMAVFLFFTDLFWQWLLFTIGILKVPIGQSSGMFHIPPLPTFLDSMFRILF